jgi:hypothetical protein
MTVEIRKVTNKRELKQFVQFPFALYRNHPFWLPPLYMDEFNFFKQGKNKALNHSDIVLYTAWEDGKMAGRVMGIINRYYNELKGQKTARFFRYECINNEEVSHALISTVEAWAVEKGMTEMIGPFGFSDKDPQGLLITGYDQRAIIIAPYNYPYYADLVEKEGYQKQIDLVEYLIPVPEKVPDFYIRIYDRVKRNHNLECIEFNKKSELKPYIIPVLRLLNETFSGIFGFYPLDEDEMKKFAADYMMILDPAFVKVVADQGKPVSFFIAIPDLGPAMQKARGRLFPFGILYLMREMKRTDYLVLMLGGISEAYQGIGLDVLMGTKMLESASKRGIKLINSHLELETNVKVRAEMEKMNGKVCKTYRIYRKALN